jgi:hypothetical protein
MFVSRAGGEQHLRPATRPTMVTTTAASLNPPAAVVGHDVASPTSSVNVDNLPAAETSSSADVPPRVAPSQNGVSSISTSNSSGSRSGHQPPHQNPTTKLSKNSVYVLVQTLHHSADPPFLRAERADAPLPQSNVDAAVAAAAAATGKKEKCTVETVVYGVYSNVEEAQHWFEAKQAQTVVVISETNEGQQLLHLDADDTVQASLQIHEVSLGMAPPGM